MAIIRNKKNKNTKIRIEFNLPLVPILQYKQELRTLRRVKASYCYSNRFIRKNSFFLSIYMDIEEIEAVRYLFFFVLLRYSRRCRVT